MKYRVLSTLLAAVLGSTALPFATAAWAENGKFSLASGFDYSTGNYGTASTTDIFSIPVIGKFSTGPWIFKLTTPYIRISGTGAVIPGTGAVGTGGTARSTQSGLGDTVAAVTYSLYDENSSAPGIDLTGKVKLATADAGLGSGANDYSAQMDVYRTLDKFTAMGTLGSKVLGSPGNGISLNTVIYGSFGGAYQFSGNTSGGVDFSLAQTPSALSIRQQELTAYVNYRIDKHFKAQGYVLKGYASGSPDSGVGGLITYGF